MSSRGKSGVIAIGNSPINHLHVSQQGSSRCGGERQNPTWLAIARTRVSGIGNSVDIVDYICLMSVESD
jgi:hypothetical protein